MATLELDYLWFADGRKPPRYPFYRRAGQLIALKDPNDKRLREGDFGVAEAWERIHASFVDDAPEKDGAIITGSLRHGIVEFRASPEWDQLKPNTHEAYDKAFNWLLTPPGTPKNADSNKPKTMRHKGTGHLTLASLDQEVVIGLRKLRYNPPEDMRYKRFSVGVFPGSANELLRGLGALFKFVKLQPRKFRLPRGWTSPTPGIPKLREGDGYRPWEEEEISDFYKRWSPETIQRVIFDTYLHTGQRGSDVWGMAREHYRRRKRPRIDLVGSLASEWEISVMQDKTRVRVWIPTADEYQPTLDSWLASHDGDWFFVTRTGEHMTQGYMEMIVRDAIRGAGLPDDCHPHGLRYAFATRMIEWGLDHQVIESIAGHSSMKMARKYTTQRRNARFGVATMNRGLAAYRAGQELLVDE